MGDSVMHYRYHHFYLPIARFLSRLSPAGKAALAIAQVLLLGALLALELASFAGVL